VADRWIGRVMRILTSPKRALVTLPDGVWKLIQNDLRGKIGDGDSEVIRNIVLSYLTEKGYFASAKVQPDAKAFENASAIKTLENKIDKLAAIFTGFAELIEEKGIITSEEFHYRTQESLRIAGFGEEEHGKIEE
jgi:outer membrane cobalamin receptor